MQITQEYLKSILEYDPDTGIFTRKTRLRKGLEIGSTAGSISSHGYCKIWVLGKQRYAHHIAWVYFYGELPRHDIDHINGIKTDNRICNLRLATDSENLQNIKSAQVNNKSTGLIGAYYDDRQKSFYSRIGINKKSIYLGSFKTKEEAHEAYIKAKRELHPYGQL